MKIATVTLNPAIDQTVMVDNFTPNAVNRAQSLQLDAGGKGVNVASFLADYGLSVAVTGFLGKDNPQVFEQHFARKRIDDRFVRIPGLTRTGIKVVDQTRRQTTDINLPGLTPSETELDRLHETINELAIDHDCFVLAGKLPPGVPDTIYADLIRRLKTQGKRVVLDTSQAALREGAQAGPTIVKPNIDELQQLVDRPLNDLAEIEAAAKQLLKSGIRLVVVSMGERGALFVDRQNALVAIPPQVEVQSTVGAGDAMVAGLIAGQTAALSLAECARLATAFSVGTITRIGAHLPPLDVLESYRQQVTTQPLVDGALPSKDANQPSLTGMNVS
ncbi:MAG TPA: 1-phosphofructokinase [Herpetosiphonaceae bacterium]